MTNDFKLKKYLKPQLKYLIISTICGIGQNTLIVIPSIILGKLIDLFYDYEKYSIKEIGLSIFFFFLISYIVISILYSTNRLIKRYVINILSNRISCHLRKDFLSEILKWPLNIKDQEKNGDLISRSIGDIHLISESIVRALYEIYDAGILLLVNVITLFVIMHYISILTISPIIVIIIIAFFIRPKIVDHANKVRSHSSKLNNQLEKMISGVRIFRLLGIEDANINHFNKISNNLKKSHIFFESFSRGIIPLYFLISAIGTFALLYKGGLLIMDNQWTIGGFTTYLSIYTFLSRRILNSTNKQNELLIGQAGWARLKDKMNKLKNYKKTIKKDVINNSTKKAYKLEIRNLNFNFPGAKNQSIKDLSLNVKEGSFIGITGAVGSGKTALAYALLGLYDYDGNIILDNKELSEINEKDRIKMISFLGQEDPLFSSSISENISFDKISDVYSDKLDQASHWSALTDDLEIFPEGYNTFVGMGGFQVSGGQKQRIALARSFYPETSLIILDDPFSAIDTDTEKKIISRIKEAFKGKTIILFSHRLASFVNSDEILVLNEGKIKEQGTHNSLMNKKGIYHNIYNAQKWIKEHS